MTRKPGSKPLNAFSILLFCLPQAGMGQETEQLSIRTRSTLVLVDAVVRDRHGKPLKGLGPDDFEVREDGVVQDLTYVRDLGVQASSEERVEPVSTPANPSGGELGPAAGSGPNQALQGRFVAIVIDRLSHDSRYSAWDAAKNYVAEVIGPDTQVGIFAIDLSLKTIQFFTADQQRLVAALDRAAGSSTAPLGEAPGLSNTLDDALAAQSEAAASVRPPDVAEGPDIASQQLQSVMNESFSLLQREHGGYATTNALLAVVNSMQFLPGRKSIVFFSEGVKLPPSVYPRYRSVISAANRSNISIYTVDAMGLRVASTAPGIISGSAALTLDGGDQSYGRPMMGILDRMEEALRSEPHYTLKVLADQTGGVFIRDTNNLRAGLRKVEEDMQSYYLLAYTPKNGDFDGRFREITVFVKVDGAEIRHRKGYYAVDADFREPLFEYEAPAVALLQKGRGDDDLPVRASVLSFPKPEDPGYVTLLADIPPGVMAYRPGEEAAVSDFAFVALVRDGSGSVVRKVSQQYRLSRPADAPDGGDSILFYRPLTLPVGRYSVEVAGFDAVAGKAGVKRLSLEIPEVDPALPGLSSLVMVRRAESIKQEERGGESPFYFSGALLYPRMSETVDKSESGEITLYFTVHPGDVSVGSAILEISRYNTRVASSEIPLPEPDAAGEIQAAPSIELSDLPAGVYSLRVSIPAGDRVVARSRRFMLVE